MNEARVFRLFVLALAGAALGACGGGSDSADSHADPVQAERELAADSPASDEPGEPDEPASSTATPLAADTTRPKVNLTSPANFATGLAGTLVATATASDDVGVEGVMFSVDGREVGSLDNAPPYRVSINTNLYPSGQHVIRARSRDVAGNLSAWSSAVVEFGGSRKIPAGFKREPAWLTGLTDATAFAQLPDGRLLIAQGGGALRVVKFGTLLPRPFVTLAVDSIGERGLLGVTPHPNFAANGYVYVYYTTTQGGVHNRVSRFKANAAAGGDVALAGSEVVIVDLPPLLATNHNGGAIHFGLDGKLHVAVGDNARTETAQDLTRPLGKMLRFNADGSIPSDNPFYDSQTGLARAIWAYGLRNPFTFAVHPDTGRIHINDVGQNTWEEINLGERGANYGWPDSEGPDDLSAAFSGPVFTYKHHPAAPAGSGPGGFFVGQVIAGGTFYPTAYAPGRFPVGYRNNYYFADFSRRFIGRLDLARNNAAYAFASLSDSPVGLLVGIDGALYALTRSGVTRISYQ